MIHIKLDKKAKDVISKTLDLSGSVVVTELPQIGEEHTIYELQEKKKKFPSLFPIANQQMVDDGVSSELSLFVFVFDTSEDMTNTLTPIIPSEQIPFCLNYIIKEDKLIMSSYADADWQFAELTKVSDYKFDISGVVGGGSSAYLVMLKEYLGMYPEGEEDAWYTGKLLNDELYTFEPNTFGIILRVPAAGIMALNNHLGEMEIPVPVPEEYTFEYIPYEKILKNQLAEIDGMNVLWVFKPNGTGEEIISTYWIYTNNAWVNVDEMSTEPPLHNTVYGTLSDVEGSTTLACTFTVDEIVNNINNGYITILEYKPTIDGSYYYCCAITGAFNNNGINLTLQTWSLGAGCIRYNPTSGFVFDSGVA